MITGDDCPSDRVDLVRRGLVMEREKEETIKLTMGK